MTKTPQPLPGGAKVANVTLDGSGNGIASIGPVVAREHWQISACGVKASTNVSEATCSIYIGTILGSATFYGTTFTGSSGDTIPIGGLDIQPGMQVFAQWKGGDAGAVGTLTVFGTYTAGAPGQSFLGGVGAFLNRLIPFFRAGNTTVIDKNGLRVYNGPPALGNLVVSEAPNAGTDSFGNAFPSGSTDFGPNASSGVVAGPITGPQMIAGTPLVYTFAFKPAPGQKVLFAFVTGATVTSVVDNSSTPITLTRDAVFTNGVHPLYIYRADNVQPTGATYTITVTTGGGGSIGGAGRAYGGLLPGSPTAVSANATGTSAAPLTNTITAAAASALYFGGMQDDTGLNPETISAPSSGFTNLGTNTNGAAFQAFAIADKFDPAAPSSTSVGWTLGDSVSWNAGVVVYDHITGVNNPASISTTVVANALSEFFNTGALSQAGPGAHLFATVFNSGTPNEQIELAIIGPTSTGSPARTDIQLLSDGAHSPGIATGFLVYWDTANVFHQIAFWGQHGFNAALTQAIVAVQPGTIDTTITAETWHPITLTPAVWTTATPVQYRFEPIGPSGRVALDGILVAAAANAAGTVVGTLPVGWRPSVAKSVPSVGAVAAFGGVSISTAGVITINNACPNGDAYSLDGISFPLG